MVRAGWSSLEVVWNPVGSRPRYNRIPDRLDGFTRRVSTTSASVCVDGVALGVMCPRTRDILKVFERDVIDLHHFNPTSTYPSALFHMFNSPSLLAALAPPSPATAATAPGGTWPPRVPRRGLKRPRGLWKARRRLDPATTATASQHQHLSHTPGSGGAKSSCSGRGSDTDREMESCGEGEGEEEEDGEEEDGDDVSQNSNSSKRQRRDSGSGRSSSSNMHINNNRNDNISNGMPMELWTVFVDSETDVGLPLTLGGVADTVGHGTPLPLSVPLPGDNVDTAADTRRRAASLISNMVTTSIGERAGLGSGSGSGSAMTTKERLEYKEWEEIKETLACASELCDRACGSLLMPVLSPRFLIEFC